MSGMVNTSTTSTNILLQDWSSKNFGVPPFDQINSADYEPALIKGMKLHIADLESIVASPESPTFENTIAAFDRAGGAYKQVQYTFGNLCASNGIPELQAVQLKMAGIMATHGNKIYTFPGLFERIDAVYAQRQDSQLQLSAEQVRLVERFHLDFVRAGAKFDKAAQEKYAKIVKDLADLTTRFQQNLLADESQVIVPLRAEDGDLAGLPEDVISSAKQAAKEHTATTTAASAAAAAAVNLGKGAEGGREEKKSEVDAPEYVITLSRSLVVPFLTFSTRADLREKAWRLWTSRGELHPERDNVALASKILKLRAEQARLHGYATFADYATADTMAGSPEKVMELLERVWTPAKASFERERRALQEFIAQSEGSTTDNNHSATIAPWDWRFYAEKVRQKSYNLDDAEVKPYFSLENMVQAIFDCANRLFGLSFVLREDIPSYHPDVKTYEVHETVDGEDKIIAIFLHDNYARPYKRSGAWMSEYREQSKNVAISTTTTDVSSVIPIIVNNNNFNRAGGGDAGDGSSGSGVGENVTLLSFTDAVTLFHEFGHGLHGMLSNVTYGRLSGTSVLRDFVELPSQLYEHWLSQPEVLKRHARHYITNEPIPDELLARVMAARSFNEGFNTVEYTACALVDTALHRHVRAAGAGAASGEGGGGDGEEGLDIRAFEKAELLRLGMPEGIVMRHRPAHFQHLFAGAGYASAYYVYLWAEVLDADGFDAFLEAGDCFDKATAERVRRCIYSTGNSLDPATAYRLFRGRDPVIEPMLRKKGLLATTD